MTNKEIVKCIFADIPVKHGEETLPHVLEYSICCDEYGNVCYRAGCTDSKNVYCRYTCESLSCDADLNEIRHPNPKWKSRYSVQEFIEAMKQRLPATGICCQYERIESLSIRRMSASTPGDRIQYSACCVDKNGNRVHYLAEQLEIGGKEPTKSEAAT